MASLPKTTEPSRLLPRERRFIREYLIDFNGSQAIQRAGFTGTRPEIAASKLLARPRVKAALAERQDQIAARLEVTVERVLKEQAAIAFSDPRRMFNENGSLKAIHEFDDASAAALAGIEVEALYEGSGEDRAQVGTLSKIKRWDKPKALEHLSKFLGILKDEAPPPPVGPGLVVMVQQSVNAGPEGRQLGQRVEVRLPLPGPPGGS